MKYLYLPLCVVVAALAYLYVPLESLLGIKDGLIAYLGFLSAAVIQVIPLTASFIQSDQLNPDQTRRLNAALNRQQIYWMGLLATTVICLIAFIIASAVDFDFGHNDWLVQPEKAVCGILAFMLSFLFSRMFGIFTGIMSLHRLRALLVEAAADERASLKAREQTALASTGNPVTLPAGYGSLGTPVP